MTSGTLAFVSTIDPPVLWVIGGVLGLVFEMLVPAFVIGSFGLSALFAGLLAWLGASLELQIAVFALLGFAFVVPARRFLHRGKARTRPGAQQLPGRRGVCVEPIDGDLQAGIVELSDARWTAITVRGGRIPKGAVVEVVAVQGERLLVTARPASDES